MGDGLRRRLRHLGAALAIGLCAGCAATGETGTGLATDAAAAPAPQQGVTAISPLGAYLAGRIAQADRDDEAALGFYQAALAHAPDDPELTARVFVLATSAGRFDLARPLAAKLLAADPTAALANLVQAVELTKAGHAADALELARHLPEDGFYRLVGAFTRAWLKADAKAPVAEALAELEPVRSEPELAPLAALHAALIEDLAGDFDGAKRDYLETLGQRSPPLRLAQLAGNFFERSGDPQRAAAIYTAFAAAGGAEGGIHPAVVPGVKPPRIVADARDGLAEAMFHLAGLVSEAESPEVAMLALRLALELRPDFPLATLMLGDIYTAEGKPAQAIAVYRGVPATAPTSWAARLRLAGPMDETGDAEGAEAVLRQMAAERPAEAQPLIELGNILRNHEQFVPAGEAYGQALDRLGPAKAESNWALHYDRGICRERAGDWPGAEADLRRALALKPDEAAILNYLGYSMVDRGVRLQEALSMIQKAVELKPKDGYIVDSLGWAYYRLGKFVEAEDALEKAVELRPGDAEINDHLGDAYWQGGRHEEAKLQWHRALSLNPQPDLAKTIEAKLEHPPARARPAAPVKR
jgi:tetratricopeptide (TPR) repeat protein